MFKVLANRPGKTERKPLPFPPPIRWEAHTASQSLPLVTKGRWQAEGLTEGIRAGNHRQLSIPQSRFARQPPLHKGAFGAAV